MPTSYNIATNQDLTNMEKIENGVLANSKNMINSISCSQGYLLQRLVGEGEVGISYPSNRNEYTSAQLLFLISVVPSTISLSWV